VLLDATAFPYLTPAALRAFRAKRNREGIDVRAAVAESDAITSLGHLPLIVLGHGRLPACSIVFPGVAVDCRA
jgi:hypothetical protein